MNICQMYCFLDWMDFCCYFIRQNLSSFPPKTKLCLNYESCLFRWNSPQAFWVNLVAWEWQLTTFFNLILRINAEYGQLWTLTKRCRTRSESSWMSFVVSLEVFAKTTWFLLHSTSDQQKGRLSSFTHDFREDQTLTIRNLAICPISQMDSTMFFTTPNVYSSGHNNEESLLETTLPSRETTRVRDEIRRNLGRSRWVTTRCIHQAKNSLIQEGPPKMCFKSHVNDGKHETCLF